MDSYRVEKKAALKIILADPELVRTRRRGRPTVNCPPVIFALFM